MSSELTIQKQFTTLMDWMAPQVKWFAIPNGGSRNPIEAVNLKKSGVKAGVADIFVMLPYNQWHGIFIEFKTKTGRQSEKQKEFEDICKDLNYYYIIFTDAKDALDLVLEVTRRDQTEDPQHLLHRPSSVLA